jgi:hypothetical protein
VKRDFGGGEAPEGAVPWVGNQGFESRFRIRSTGGATTQFVVQISEIFDVIHAFNYPNYQKSPAKKFQNSPRKNTPKAHRRESNDSLDSAQLDTRCHPPDTIEHMRLITFSSPNSPAVNKDANYLVAGQKKCDGLLKSQ